jgi:hypothetical protein
MYVPTVKDSTEEEMFNAYSNDLNSVFLFADKIILVEGESDLRVIQLLLERKYGAEAHRVSVISASGNKNFSPFLRMIKAWAAAKLPHLVVTDFDSLTKLTERAIVTGAKAAGYVLSGEAAFYQKVDAVLDKDEPEFEAAAKEATSWFSSSGLNVFVFTSDLEYSLVSRENKTEAAEVMSQCRAQEDYTKGYDINSLRRHLGSKGVPLNPMNDPPLKKPYVHRKVAQTIDFNNSHPDIGRLMAAVEAL